MELGYACVPYGSGPDQRRPHNPSHDDRPALRQRQPARSGSEFGQRHLRPNAAGVQFAPKATIWRHAVAGARHRRRSAGRTERRSGVPTRLTANRRSALPPHGAATPFRSGEVSRERDRRYPADPCQCFGHAIRSYDPAHLRHHLASGRRQDDADREATSGRRRDRDGGCRPLEGQRPARQVRLDGH